MYFIGSCKKEKKCVESDKLKNSEKKKKTIYTLMSLEGVMEKKGYCRVYSICRGG